MYKVQEGLFKSGCEAMSELKIDVEDRANMLFFSIKRLERVLIHFNIIENLPYGRYKIAKRYIHRYEED